jgi:hypothetical protein
MERFNRILSSNRRGPGRRNAAAKAELVFTVRTGRIRLSRAAMEQMGLAKGARVELARHEGVWHIWRNEADGFPVRETAKGEFVFTCKELAAAVCGAAAKGKLRISKPGNVTISGIGTVPCWMLDQGSDAPRP